MKRKIFLLIMLIFLICFTGCVQETYENGVPTYFLEPDGYIIAKISCGANIFSKGYYGYISELDYENYLSGNLNGALIVLDPYKEGKSVSVNSDYITSIYTGAYLDYR